MILTALRNSIYGALAFALATGACVGADSPFTPDVAISSDLTMPTLPGPSNSGPMLTLDQALARALSLNPQIKTADHNIREAEDSETLNNVQRGLTIEASATGSITSYKTTATPGSVTVTPPGLSGYSLPTITDTSSGSLFSGTGSGSSFSTTASSGSGSSTTTSSTTTINPVSSAPVTNTSPTMSSPSVSGSGAGNAGTVAPNNKLIGMSSYPTPTVVHTPAVAALINKLAAATLTPDQSSGSVNTGQIESLLGSYGSNYNYGAGISASQVVDVYRLVDLAASVLHENTQFFVLDRDRIANELAVTVKAAYYQALMYQSNIDTAEESLKNAQVTLRDATVKFQAGASAQYDVDSGQSQLLSAQQSLIAARNNLVVEMQTLNTLMGEAADASFKLVAPPLPELPDGFDIKSAVQSAQMGRPEIQQANVTIDLARKVTRLEAAGLKPSFGVGASVDYTGAYPGVDGKYYEGALLATINIPLDDAGKTRANVRIARENEAQQANLKTQLDQDIELEVRNAAINVINAQALVASDQSSVQYNHELVRIADIRYQDGAGTLLELTTAQADLAIAETNLASAEYQLQSSYSGYLRAIGKR